MYKTIYFPTRCCFSWMFRLYFVLSHKSVLLISLKQTRWPAVLRDLFGRLSSPLCRPSTGRSARRWLDMCYLQSTQGTASNICNIVPKFILQISYFFRAIAVRACVLWQTSMLLDHTFRYLFTKYPSGDIEQMVRIGSTSRKRGWFSWRDKLLSVQSMGNFMIICLLSNDGSTLTISD